MRCIPPKVRKSRAVAKRRAAKRRHVAGGELVSMPRQM
jgi:hypothetical protein